MVNKGTTMINMEQQWSTRVNKGQQMSTKCNMAEKGVKGATGGKKG